MNKLILAVVVGLLLSPVIASAAGLEDEKWRKANSANFEIYSQLGERKTIDLLRHLEVLRRMFSTSEGSLGDAPVPTLIVVVKRERSLKQLRGGTEFAGVFQSGIRSNKILMREIFGDENSLILHEYTHFLLHNASSMTYPAWYQEGFAELLSTTSVGSKYVRLFGFDDYNIQVLSRYRWLDAKEILDPQPRAAMNDKEMSLFYAQSWALVHFLANREPQIVPTSAGLEQYAQFRSQGMGRVEAFENAFKLNADTLNKHVEDYLDNDCCVFRRGPVEGFVQGFDPKVEKANADEVALALGRMSEAFGQADVARNFFGRAAKNVSTKGPALAGLARLSVSEGDYDAAEDQFSAALDADPENNEVLLDYAIWNSGVGLEQGEYNANVAVAQEAFDALNDHGHLTPLYFHARGRFEMFANNDYEEAVRLLSRAYTELPSDKRIQADLALALANSGRDVAAMDVLRNMISWSFEQPEVTEWAQARLNELESRN